MTIACKTHKTVLPALVFLCGTINATAEQPTNAPVKEESYVLVFQEFSRFDSVKQRNRERDTVMADVFNNSLPTETVVDAIVELGLTSPPNDIPWRKLLELAQRPGVHDTVALWAIVSAGKALCCSPRPQQLERWLFREMKGDKHVVPAIVVLGVSRIAGNTTLHEWARLLRDPATSDEACRSIAMYSIAWGAIYEGGKLDDGVNCLLSGYDEESLSQNRKLLIWESLSLVADAAIYRGHIENVTLWTLHELALREFSNERNSDELRSTAASGIIRGEAISKAAFASAMRIRDESLGTSRLQSAANHVLSNAGKYGIEE